MCKIVSIASQASHQWPLCMVFLSAAGLLGFRLAQQEDLFEQIKDETRETFVRCLRDPSSPLAGRTRPRRPTGTHPHISKTAHKCPKDH